MSGVRGVKERIAPWCQRQLISESKMLCVHAFSIVVQVFVISQTVVHQDPLSVNFSRQEYWSRLPFPPPGDLPDQGIRHISLVFPELTGRFLTTSATWEEDAR